MKILQISNDYLGSIVFQKQFREFDKHGYDQTVLCYIKKGQITAEKMPFSNSNIKEYYVKLGYSISLLGRIFPILKNNILLKFYLSNSLGPFDFIHAHTLVSNGSFALMLNKKKNIPYIVTVRNTDINFVLKYFWHLKWLILQIINNSERIVFVSPVHKKKLLEFFKHDSQSFNSILTKSEIIPNGIDDFWIINRFHPKTLNLEEPINLLFVGEISENKNILFILETFEQLPQDKFKLRIVGGTKNKPKNKEYLKSIKKRIAKMNGVIFMGEIYDKIELLNIYRESHIFIMVSKFETFGLVYIEAMTQGCPIIFTRGQGIDGYFNDGLIGNSINNFEVGVAKDAIFKTIRNYNEMSKQCIYKSKNFSWKSVSVKYDQMIKSMAL